MSRILAEESEEEVVNKVYSIKMMARDYKEKEIQQRRDHYDKVKSYLTIRSGASRAARMQEFGDVSDDSETPDPTKEVPSEPVQKMPSHQQEPMPEPEPLHEPEPAPVSQPLADDSDDSLF